MSTENGSSAARVEPVVMRLRALPDYVLEYLAPMQCMTAEREELCRRRNLKPPVAELVDAGRRPGKNSGDRRCE